VTEPVPDEQERAMQDLVDLTEELGLYDDTDAAGEPRRVASPVCSSCNGPHQCGACGGRSASCPWCAGHRARAG
jgi:hypothetical protein